MTDSSRPDKILDCIGLYCPEPLFQTREQIDLLDIGGILLVIADDPAAEEDIKRFAKRTGHKIINFEKDGDTLKFFIKKTK
jgi:tRNA 2-thiouridine synthesizing protein A